MAINKIVLNTDKGEQTLVDLTGDTVTADKMIVGTIAHDKSGEKITGTNPYELEATNTEVQTQTDLIEQIQNALVGKASGGGENTPTQEKTVDIAENGTHEIIPDTDFALSKVTVNVDVPIPDGYIQPEGTLEIIENGTYDVTEKVEVNVNVVGGVIDNRNLYQRIEYIETTTGCLMETDIFANNETGMEMLASFPTLADRVPMGSRLDGNATRFYIPYPLSSNSFYYGFNSGITKSTGAKPNVIYRSSNNFLNNRVATVKEEETNAMEFADMLTSTLSTQTAPIGIFCYLRKKDEEFALQSSRDFIFYGARISQGNEIIREYIPCYRKSDGEIGLYEKFTGEFLTNNGTGTLTKGADVEW